MLSWQEVREVEPSWPDGVDVCPVCYLDNQGDVGVIVVVAAAWNFNELVGHPDVLCVNAHVLWRRHRHQTDSTFVPKSLVCPASNAADEFYGSYAVVGHKHAAKETLGIAICPTSTATRNSRPLPKDDSGLSFPAFDM